MTFLRLYTRENGIFPTKLVNCGHKLEQLSMRDRLINLKNVTVVYSNE